MAVFEVFFQLGAGIAAGWFIVSLPAKWITSKFSR